MTQNTFYVIEIEQDGKRHAYAETISNSNNLIGRFPDNAISVNACDTLKEAKRIAECWNGISKEKGIWLYGKESA